MRDSPREHSQERKGEERSVFETDNLRHGRTWSLDTPSRFSMH